MKRALVLGATGQLGSAVAVELLRHGWAVDAASGSGRFLPPDLAALGARPIDARGRSRRALVEDGPGHDAVFDPTAYVAADARDLMGAPEIGALVTVSSVSVYADAQGRTLDEGAERGYPDFGGPLAEDRPTVAAGPETYSTRKIAMEEALREAPWPVTVLRPGAIHGPHARHPREWWLLKRGLDGRKRIPVAHGARSRFHTASAAGIASLARLCLEAPGHRTLNVADPDAPSVAEIAAALEGITGLRLPLAPFEGPFGPDRVGASPWSAPHPIVVDTAAARALGWDGGAPYAEAVRPLCAWMLAAARRGDWREAFPQFLAYPRDPFDYAAEDRARLREDGG